jgi:hypothetical protein
MGQILLAGKEPHKRPALLGDVVANRAAEHRIADFERIEDGALRDWIFNLELHLTVDLRQRSQMKGEEDSNHGNVCTSTETTAGKSRTMGAQ